jgi:hypothetical protein
VREASHTGKERRERQATRAKSEATQPGEKPHRPGAKAEGEVSDPAEPDRPGADGACWKSPEPAPAPPAMSSFHRFHFKDRNLDSCELVQQMLLNAVWWES